MKKYDVLIGMSQNIRLGSSRGDIEASPIHLSYLSEEVAITAAVLFQKGFSDFILFTGGFTTKFSESDWMKKYIHNKFPQIKDEEILIEEDSWDTSSSIKETVKIIQEKGFQRIGVITASFHKNRTKHFFKRYGINLKNEDIYESRKIVSDLSEEYKKRADTQYNSLPIRLERYLKEPVLNLDLIFDPDGRIPRKITSKSRG